MSWGTQRRNSIIAVFTLVILAILVLFIFDALYEPPNCFDGKHNGNEVGIDCGGVCDLLCHTQVLDPIVRWTRLFEVSPGVYNVLAYIENPNPVGELDDIVYRFRIFDENNALLQERRGRTSLSAKSILPILENSLVVGKLDAVRVSFDFLGEMIWTRGDVAPAVIAVQDETISNLEDEPRIRAILHNTDIVPLQNVKVVAIVYDKDDNAIASSSTIFDVIPANGNVEAFFVWPVPFSEDVARFEIMPVYERSDR